MDIIQSNVELVKVILPNILVHEKKILKSQKFLKSQKKFFITHFFIKYVTMLW